MCDWWDEYLVGFIVGELFDVMFELIDWLSVIDDYNRLFVG